MRTRLFPVLAGLLLAPLLALPDHANAGSSDLGCTVALCMANPKGPWELAECVPSMRDLQKRLASGRSFPRCSMGGGGSTEKKGDLIVFRLAGQPTKYFNYKTGQMVEGPNVGVGGSGGSPASGGNKADAAQQLR